MYTFFIQHIHLEIANYLWKIWKCFRIKCRIYFLMVNLWKNRFASDFRFQWSAVQHSRLHSFEIVLMRMTQRAYQSARKQGHVIWTNTAVCPTFVRQNNRVKALSWKEIPAVFCFVLKMWADDGLTYQIVRSNFNCPSCLHEKKNTFSPMRLI